MKLRSPKHTASAFICMTDLLVAVTTGVLVVGAADLNDRQAIQLQRENALRAVLQKLSEVESGLEQSKARSDALTRTIPNLAADGSSTPSRKETK